MMKRWVPLALSLLLLFSFAACDVIQGSDAPEISGTGGSGDNDLDIDTSQLTDGTWPDLIYSSYGIDKPETDGQIVYTDFLEKGQYQYRVFFYGITHEEVNTWVSSLLEKGFRMTDRCKERLETSCDSDIALFFPTEQSPYRLRLAFDFDGGMSIAYDGEDNPAYGIVEKENDDGKIVPHIPYHFEVSLSPLKTDEEYVGCLSLLDLQAEDLKGIEGVRAVLLTEQPYGTGGGFYFYSDCFVTEEKYDACRQLLFQKMAEKGVKLFFFDSEVAPEDIQPGKTGITWIEKDGATYDFITHPDSSWGDFGGSYRFILSPGK